MWSQPFLFAENYNSDTRVAFKYTHVFTQYVIILLSLWEKLHSGLDLNHLNKGKSLVAQSCRCERFAVQGRGQVINCVFLNKKRKMAGVEKWLLTCKPLLASQWVCEVEDPGRPGSTPCGRAFLCSVDTIE